jgi:hypothetical protein
MQNVQDGESERLTFPNTKNDEFRPESGSVSDVLAVPYKIERFTGSKLDGLTLKIRSPSVEKTRDEFESRIDEALTGKFDAFALQTITALPEMSSNCSSPPSPDPIPAVLPFALIVPRKIESVATTETLRLVPGVPAAMPAAELELAQIFPETIVRFTTVECPE